MKTQIPTYRAKLKDTDKNVEGYLLDDEHIGDINMNCYPEYALDDVYGIDPSTLAIHFPDMLDSEGTKIFASLSEDGKGGDILEFPHHKEIVIYSKGRIQLGLLDFVSAVSISKFYKVTGIQQ